jgi:hypothetical protein
MKIIGKPYSGKPNVRFDERELEIEHAATTPALYSTEMLCSERQSYKLDFRKLSIKKGPLKISRLPSAGIAVFTSYIES